MSKVTHSAPESLQRSPDTVTAIARHVKNLFSSVFGKVQVFVSGGSNHVAMIVLTVQEVAYRAQTQIPPEVPTELDIHSGPIQPMERPESQPKLPSTNSAQLRPHLTEVYQGYLKRLTAQRIYQDLVEDHCYRGSHDSVKR